MPDHARPSPLCSELSSVETPESAPAALSPTAARMQIHTGPSQQPTRSDIIAVGGAEDKENEKQILWDVFHRAGGRESFITIVPAASGIPMVLGELYREIFIGMGAERERVHILDIRNPSEAQHPEAVQLIEQSTGIYFTGGDQERLSEVLATTELMRRVRQQCQAGQTVIAGTSAGASALGYRMISRGYSGESPTPAIVTVKTGLSILPQVIVDQHFHQRNRLVRLLTAVAYHPYCLGIGIDENTAAIFYADETVEVIGSGTVTLVDGSEMGTSINETPEDGLYTLHNAKVHFLSPGSRFNIHSMQFQKGS